MDPDKILQHIVGRTQISCAKILEPWAKGAQNGGEKSGSFFVTGTMNSHFFVTVQSTDRHEIWAKTSIAVT